MSTDPWHVYHDAPWLGAVHLKPVLVGVANRAPSSLLKPHPPVTRAMILILAAKLDLLDPFDCYCTAAASAVFWGQLCLGEVLSPWELSFPTSHVMSCAHLSPPITQNRSHKLFLPYTKVKRSRGEEVILCWQQDTSDPILTLEYHLQLNMCPTICLLLFSVLCPPPPHQIEITHKMQHNMAPHSLSWSHAHQTADCDCLTPPS